MVELVNQREGPAPVAVQREREDRVAGRRRRRHRVRRQSHSSAQRRPRSGPAPATSQPHCRRTHSSAARPRQTGTAHAHVAVRDRGLAGHVAGAAGNAVARASVGCAFENAVLVNRPGRRVRRCAIGVSSSTVITRPSALPTTEVTVGVSRLNDRAKIDRQVILVVALSMVELVDQRELQLPSALSSKVKTSPAAVDAVTVLPTIA